MEKTSAKIPNTNKIVDGIEMCIRDRYQIEAVLRTFIILKSAGYNGKIGIITEFLPRQRCQLITQQMCIRDRL